MLATTQIIHECKKEGRVLAGTQQISSVRQFILRYTTQYEKHSTKYIPY